MAFARRRQGVRFQGDALGGFSTQADLDDGML